jgi:hypothetical protein
MPLVAKRKPPLESALRAKHRRRHLHLFVEREIVGFNYEFFMAILTGFYLGVHATSV